MCVFLSSSRRGTIQSSKLGFIVQLNVPRYLTNSTNLLYNHSSFWFYFSCFSLLLLCYLKREQYVFILLCKYAHYIRLLNGCFAFLLQDLKAIFLVYSLSTYLVNKQSTVFWFGKQVSRRQNWWAKLVSHTSSHKQNTKYYVTKQLFCYSLLKN